MLPDQLSPVLQNKSQAIPESIKASPITPLYSSLQNYQNKPEIEAPTDTLLAMPIIYSGNL